MSDISIRTQIKKLVELQKIDFEIYSFKRELKEKPDFIAQLKEKLDKAIAAEEFEEAARIRDKIKELEKRDSPE